MPGTMNTTSATPRHPEIDAFVSSFGKSFGITFGIASALALAGLAVYFGMWIVRAYSTVT